jgi:hypothetical protein
VSAREKVAALAHHFECAALDALANGMALQKVAVTYSLMAKTMSEDDCEKFLCEIGQSTTSPLS